MEKQIKLLTRIALCNLMGFNEFRYTKEIGRASCRERVLAGV